MLVHSTRLCVLNMRGQPREMRVSRTHIVCPLEIALCPGETKACQYRHRSAETVPASLRHGKVCPENAIMVPDVRVDKKQVNMMNIVFPV